MITIIPRVRNLIPDNYIFIPDDVQTYSTSLIFDLQYANISAASLKVYKNGSLWASSNYSYDADTGKVTVTGTIAAGNILTFTYNAYTKYSDAEIEGYIKSALYWLSVEKYGDFTIESGDVIDPEPTEAEENLIAVIASILIKGSVRSYSTKEVSITFAEGMSVEQKIKQVLRQFNKAYGFIDYIDPTESDAIDD